MTWPRRIAQTGVTDGWAERVFMRPFVLSYGGSTRAALVCRRA
jgi:hypothetical protein